MRLLLLQDHIYLPTFGGGTKANRLLMENLARNGHECAVISPALNNRAGPSTVEEFVAEMTTRHLAWTSSQPDLFSYRYNGVHVDAINFSMVQRQRDYVICQIEEFAPDWIFVNDDKCRFLLECATTISPHRTVLLLQTIINLPFGPLAAQPDEIQTHLMHQAQGIVVISNFLKDYIKSYSGLNSHLIPFPVYGDGPFPNFGCYDRGFITMINPCVEKGLDIFMALAQEFPELPFAAVPTWGADEKVMQVLRETPNLTIIPPVDNIDEVLQHTRVLLAPSLWPETFGYVVPEAMLRGIPVLASQVGGLPEAKLGVKYSLPVVPAERKGKSYICPPQDITSWAAALRELLADATSYNECAQASREAALAYVASINECSFEEFLKGLTMNSAQVTEAHNSIAS